MIYIEHYCKFLFFFFLNSQLFKKFHLPTYFMYFKHSLRLPGAWNSYGSIYCRIEGEKYTGEPKSCFY